MELNPSYPNAYQWYAHYLLATGCLEEALTAMKRALELDPLSIPCNLGVGWCLYHLRQYDQAIEQYRRTLEIAPQLPMAHYELGLVYQNQKLYPAALAEFKKGYTLSGGASTAVL